MLKPEQGLKKSSVFKKGSRKRRKDDHKLMNWPVLSSNFSNHFTAMTTCTMMTGPASPIKRLLILFIKMLLVPRPTNYLVRIQSLLPRCLECMKNRVTSPSSQGLLQLCSINPIRQK